MTLPFILSFQFFCYSSWNPLPWIVVAPKLVFFPLVSFITIFLQLSSRYGSPLLKKPSPATCLQNKFKTLSNAWKIICKNGHNPSHPIRYIPLPYDSATPPIKTWSLLLYPWNLDLTIGLALNNRTLEYATHLRLCKVLAYWGLSSLAIFGILSQLLWRRSPCLHTGEWNLLENRTDSRLTRTEVSKLQLTDQIQPTIYFDIAGAKNDFYSKTLV